MSTRPQTPDERDSLAAEYALGVLDGEALARAQALAATDSEFRAAAGRWSGRLAPMLDEVAPEAAPPLVWSAIERAIGPVSANTNTVAQLSRSVRLWRGVSAATTALAACLAIVLLVQPRSQPAAPPSASSTAPAPPLVAMLGSDDRTKLVASWDPTGRRLMLAVAGDMPSDPAHAHELWVIPAGGKPRSLGTMDKGKQMHMSVEQALATLLRAGATIAVSVEPAGGSPTGQPTGPVIASGTLQTA